MPNKRLPSTADALRNESTASNTRRFSLERGERLSSTRPWQQTDLDWAYVACVAALLSVPAFRRVDHVLVVCTCQARRLAVRWELRLLTHPYRDGTVPRTAAHHCRWCGRLGERSYIGFIVRYPADGFHGCQDVGRAGVVDSVPAHAAHGDSAVLAAGTLVGDRDHFVGGRSKWVYDGDAAVVALSDLGVYLADLGWRLLLDMFVDR